jgi:hypothetical protein
MAHRRMKLLVALSLMRTLLDLQMKLNQQEFDVVLTGVMRDITRRYGKQNIPAATKQVLENLFEGEVPTFEEIFEWRSDGQTY